MNRKTIGKNLSIAEEDAFATGRYLSEHMKDETLVEYEQGKNVKISVDREAENLILEILSSKPDYDILSEEKGF